LASVPIPDLGLEPVPDWASGLRAAWEPGEAAGTRALRSFCETAFADYQTGRNLPAVAGTSRLSPYLHFGEISPRRVWREIHQFAARRGMNIFDHPQYLAELGWREFAHHLLHHFPHTPTKPLREAFANFPWRKDAWRLRAWQKGRTGYPLVDAGMRQLWATGWMHNRVRMVVASFLVKDLLLPWQEGARWFWDTLVDADLASNTLGWQWTAGCGADAAPFFRIFNPSAQGEKFDPEGDYVRQWVPELRTLPAKWIHQPWSAPADVLASSNVELGRTYPERIVDHRLARDLALRAYEGIKKG
jgi:deoxyribodipyrimidine photo-lyase